MKKSDVYRTAIAAVINRDDLDITAKIEVIRQLCDDLSTAEFVERCEVEK